MCMYPSFSAVSVPDWFRNETRHGHLLSILQWSHSQTGLGMRLGAVPVVHPSVVSVPDWFRNETWCGTCCPILQWSHSQTGLGMRLGVITYPSFSVRLLSKSCSFTSRSMTCSWTMWRCCLMQWGMYSQIWHTQIDILLTPFWFPWLLCHIGSQVQ